MRCTPLQFSFLLSVSCLLGLVAQAQADDQPSEPETVRGADPNAPEAQPEEGEGENLPAALAADAPSSTALPGTGLVFRINRRLTLEPPADSRNDGGVSTAPLPTDAADPDTVSACDSVSVALKRGNLAASNSSTDALVSFSELPPGPYSYKAECRNANTIGTGYAEGTVDVVVGNMTELPITIEVGGRPIEGVYATVSGDSLSSSYGSPDQKGGDLDSKTRDLTILANLGYITSADPHQDVAPLAFTDLGVWSIAAAFTPERRLTFGGKVVGLAKSPASLDAKVMQAAGANLSYAFGRHLAATAGGLWQAGRDTTRSVVSAGGGVTWRKQHAEFVKTEFSLGAQGVMHRGTAMDGNRSSTFATGSAEVQLCWNNCYRRFGATWFGFDAAIPLSHSDESAMLVGAKPNSALGFHVGSFMRVNDTFDLFAEVAWADRGDADAIETEFGTLLGGFDQIQMSLGAIFYFSFGKERPRSNSDYVRAL